MRRCIGPATAGGTPGGGWRAACWMHMASPSTPATPGCGPAPRRRTAPGASRLQAVLWEADLLRLGDFCCCCCRYPADDTILILCCGMQGGGHDGARAVWASRPDSFRLWHHWPVSAVRSDLCAKLTICWLPIESLKPVLHSLAAGTSPLYMRWDGF
jgi:hypothetical protein